MTSTDITYGTRVTRYTIDDDSDGLGHGGAIYVIVPVATRAIFMFSEPIYLLPCTGPCLPLPYLRSTRVYSVCNEFYLPAYAVSLVCNESAYRGTHSKMYFKSFFLPELPCVDRVSPCRLSGLPCVDRVTRLHREGLQL